MTTMSEAAEPRSASPSTFSFPDDFVWGTATSAYQIEGAVHEDGRGPSIWDDFCARPGAVTNGDSGRIACDHYHRWKDDVSLISSLGLSAYRFSIAWPRILPEGTGAVNAKGLDFYDRLVDALLDAGITPYTTLYHWDLPSALEKRGGWRVRETSEAFANYSRVVAERLGDRVRNWITFNEPWCIADLGHRTGDHAPGRKDDEKTVRNVYHHMLLGHGWAADAIKSVSGDTRVGFVHLTGAPEPLFEDDDTIRGAKAAFRRQNAWVLDPLYRGEYPADQWDALGKATPDVQPGDMKAIGGRMDFLGVNAYSSWEYVDRDGSALIPEKWFPRTFMEWPITPECLYWATRFANEEYRPGSIYITESGCAFPDTVNAQGEVQDIARVAYLKAHLRGVQRATAEGVPVNGYFLWSMLDNFEWAYGYAKRFGIIHVNFDTLKRTPKLSARWYSQVAALNRV